MSEIEHKPMFTSGNALQDSFELYGTRFSWVRGDHTQFPNNGEIPLVREHVAFLTDSVSWLSRGDDWLPWFGTLGKDYAYRWEGTAEFVVPRDGSLVRAFINPGADLALVEFVLCRGIIPRLLHLRGIPCLHASAVRVGQTVVAFSGPSGRGKSTLVAALVARGFPLVTDDVLPLRPVAEGTGVLAGPGLPEIRLYMPTAELAGLAESTSPPGRGQTKGRWTAGSAQFARDSAPLARLYLLEPGPLGSQQMRRARSGPRLKPKEALLALIRNSSWLHASETRALASDMICFTRAIPSVPISRLYFELAPHSFDAVARLLRRSLVR